MSWRGSFVTEYIYCDNCRDAVREKAEEGYTISLPVPSIIAGYFSDICSGEDWRILHHHMREAQLCPGHKVVMAIMPESERKHFLTLVGPRKKRKAPIAK